MEKRHFKPELLLILVLPIVLSLLANSGGAPSSRSGTVSAMQIYLATAVLTSGLAFFLYLQKDALAWATAVFLPVIYSVLILQFTLEQVSIFKLFLPMLIFAGLDLILLKHVFFNSLFLKFRTILFSLLAGGAMTLYFRLQYLMMKVPPEPGFWLNHFVNSLLLFIFIALGLSIADMIIVRREVAEMKARRRAAILNDEIDDEDGDAL